MEVKNYIDINLDPSNKNFPNDKSIQEILSSLEITDDDYHWELSISPETDCEAHYEKKSRSLFCQQLRPSST